MEYNVQKAQIFIRTRIIVAAQAGGKTGIVMKQHPQMRERIRGMKHPDNSRMQPQSEIAEVSGESLAYSIGYFREEMGKIWSRSVSSLQSAEMSSLPAPVVGYSPALARQPLHCGRTPFYRDRQANRWLSLQAVSHAGYHRPRHVAGLHMQT